ncbi:NlpC/P60 family protein [Streptomyces sp. NPDC050625]|uniref:C40 family peptidase n=1 Tax=Streptomyces sp. NPDC050625 TaxID=3154629 RepID=UPI0034381CA4
MATESRDEVRRRIDNLYDRAENATGNYNATRAMSAGNRGRGVPLRKRPGGGNDPELDQVTRQWFDAARSKLGPTVPAVLPADRMPQQRSSGNRGAAPARGGFPGGELEKAVRPLPPELAAGLSDRPIAELPGRSEPELPGRPIAELTARPVAALPAAPERRLELEAAPGALLPAPAPGPRRPSPADSKGQNQRKLTAARDLLSRYAARSSAPIAAVESVPPAQESWFPQPTLDATDSFTTGTLPVQPAVTDAAMTPFATDPLTGTGSFATGTLPTQTAVPAVTADPYATDPYATGSFATGSFATGSFATNALTDTGSFAAPVGAGGVPESAYGGRAMKALAFARAQIGRPCVWGATGPDSYDCSSLTQAAWKAAGVALPRAAAEQAHAGTPVAVADIQIGDLVVFFDNASHVGFCTGNGMMIHAPGPGSSIREESIYGAGESAIHQVIRPA